VACAEIEEPIGRLAGREHLGREGASLDLRRGERILLFPVSDAGNLRTAEGGPLGSIQVGNIRGWCGIDTPPVSVVIFHLHIVEFDGTFAPVADHHKHGENAMLIGVELTESSRSERFLVVGDGAYGHIADRQLGFE
jgi:hypothetical protein